MTPEDWQKLRQAFEKVLALEGTTREDFLASFALAEPELIDQLQSLLQADEDGDSELRARVAASAETFLQDTQDPWIGRTLDNWTLKSRLAGGGMGTVFLAERADEQYSQTVAVKVMAAQLLGTGAINRFKSERQILANLNHPYIAQLIDGGSTEDGVPFLVMEYIAGLPVDQHCDERRLSIDERLKLFCKICEAVDFAHRNLVVHRDLKPSNILIDANSNPKLLDFGIAKLLETESIQHTVAVTREGMRAMTPEYASPEQVRGEPISVASDVYALGVLLYKLMTGQSPYGISTATTTPREYEEAILSNEPRKPSTVVTSRDGDTGAARPVSPERLRKQLLGDLDNIVLRALQKEPARRYPTAVAFAADIGRFLAHEPVEARGDDWWYRSHKFAVRNARGLMIALLAVVSITGLVTFYTMKLADERDRANLAAAQSNEVAVFLTSLFESASPHEAKGDPVTAVDLLEQGRARIEALDAQPKLKANLMRIMASSMTGIGDFERSAAMLERVLQLQEAEVPRDEISLSQTTHSLAEAYRQQGQLEKAEAYERRTLQIATTVFGPNNSDVAYLMARLGVILFDARKSEEALELEQSALEIMIANGDGETPNAVDTRGNIANVLTRLGRHVEAEAILREAVALSDRTIGEMHPNTIIRRTNLCLVLTRLGKLEEAVDILTENIARGVQVWGADYYHVATMQGTRGAVLKRLGRMDKSLSDYRAAQAITRSRIGEDNLIYVGRLRGTGSVLMDLARYDEAEALFLEAIGKAIAIDGEESADVDRLNLFLGQMNIDRQRYAEAEELLRPLLQKIDGFSQANGLTLMKELGDALSSQGKFAEAEVLILDALEGQELATGLNHAVNLPTYGVAAAHFRRSGDLDTSLQYGERIAAIIDADPEPLIWSAAMALGEYGETLHALGRDTEALAVLEQTQEVLQTTFGDLDPRVVRMRNRIQTIAIP